jgi:hypothetical protein
MIQASTLNFVTVFLMLTIALFLARGFSARLIERNPESPVGKAMGYIYN